MSSDLLNSGKYSLSSCKRAQLSAFALGSVIFLFHLVGLSIVFCAGYRLGWPIPIGLLCIFASIFSVWAWTPIFGYSPATAQPINEKDCPEIVSLVREICAQFGTHVPEILMSPVFTAGYARLGFRRNPTLLLGHPLLAVLNHEELVTVISHELAHAIDGSKTRTLFMATAQRAIGRFSLTFKHCARTLEAIGLPTLISGILYKIAQFWWMVSRWLEVFISADYRNAEFVADYYALSISGYTETATLFQKLAAGMLQPVQHAYQQANPAEKTAAIRKALHNVPDKQKQDIWARVLAVEVSPNSRHPHLAERIEQLRHFQHVQPKVVLDLARFGRIQAELSGWTN